MLLWEDVLYQYANNSLDYHSKNTVSTFQESCSTLHFDHPFEDDK